MKTPRNSVHLTCISIALLGFTTGIAKAATLATYEFANANATTQATDVTGSAASWSFTAAVIGFGGSAESAFVQTVALGTTFDEDKYLTFNLTAAEGMVLNLASFSFDLGGNVSTSGTAVVSAELRTDAGASPYGAPLVVGQPAITTATHTITSDGATYTNYLVDLGSPDYQGLESITFRLHVASSVTNNSRFLRFDNFSIEGAVVTAPIPEPSSAALLGGVAVLGLVVCKRRRSQ